MNFKFTVTGGGLFSRFLQCAIIPLADMSFDKVYLTALPVPPVNFVDPHVQTGVQYVHDTVDLLKENGVVDPWDNIFNFVLDQPLDQSFQDGGVLPIGRFYNYDVPIEGSYNYKNYKQVYSKFKIKDDIIARSNQIDTDWDTVLGVHVRLKDANSVDDPKTFEDYVKAIEFNLKNYSYSKIFVSSDNSISITKLEKLFPGMILSNQLCRSDNENADSFIWEYRNYFRKHYWADSMVDCLTLSKCNTLICKNSNFGNAAIVFGNFSHIHRLKI